MPEVVVGHPSLIMVTSESSNVRSYHAYKGGPRWVATVPPQAATPRSNLTFSAKIPSKLDFIQGLTQLCFPRGSIRSARRTRVHAIDYSLVGDSIAILFHQNPRIGGTKSFSLSGQVALSLECNKGIASLKFEVEDVFGFRRRFALSHNGYDTPSLTIEAGGQFYKIRSIHSDGVRMRMEFWVNSHNPNIVTLYAKAPSKLYRLGQVKKLDFGFNLPIQPSILVVSTVEAVRRLEKAILEHGRNYDLGRVGAEIAFTVGTRILSLKGLIMNDPSKGGKDLWTRDQKVVIQSRLLARTLYATLDQCKSELRRELVKLSNKLRQDFDYNQKAATGYAILSYVTTSRTVRTIVARFHRNVITKGVTLRGGPGAI